LKIVLGTVQFGMAYGVNNPHGKPSMNEVESILDYAYKAGVEIVDTAEAYGDAHERIGAYHNGSENRLEVITKLNFSDEDKNADVTVTERINNMLDQLLVDSLYSVMFHSFADLTEYYHRCDREFKVLLDSGKVKKIGVSLYTNNELEQALTHDLISLVQLPFNLLDNINLRGKALEMAKQKDVEVHTRSAFLQGLFFKDVAELGNSLSSLIDPLNRIKGLAENYGLSIGQLALAYVIAQEQIDKVLIGVDNLAQLKQDLHYADTLLPADVMEEISNVEVVDPRLLNPNNWP